MTFARKLPRLQQHQQFQQSLLFSNLLCLTTAFWLILTVSARAEEIPKLDELPITAQQEWLRLLHFPQRNGVAISISKVKGSSFFLNARGASNAAVELEETYRLMFLSSQVQRKQTQCQFPARRDFFKRNFLIQTTALIYCEEVEAWIGQLQASSVSFIFASAFLNSAGSSFGHTFLKLNNPSHSGSQELLDYGINFSARTAETEGMLYAFYGLFGYFPGGFTMLPYHHMLKNYTHLEGRDIWEYRLNLTSEETKRLIYHLLDLDRSYFDYYFIDENCSMALRELLQIARPEMKLEYQNLFMIPLDAVKVVENSGLVQEVNFRPSLKTEWRGVHNSLNATQKKLVVDAFDGKANPELLDLPSIESLQSLVLLKSFGQDPKSSEIRRLGDLEFAVNQARAGLGQDFSRPSIGGKKVPPHLSHNSSWIEVAHDSYGQMMFGLSPAFHRYESSDIGASKNSHLEALSFLFAVNSPKLQKLTFLKILSTESADDISKPLSWGLDFNIERRELINSDLAPNLTLDFGLSEDFFDEKLNVHLFAEPFVAALEPHQSYFSIGMRSLNKLRLTEQRRFTLDWRWNSLFQERSLAFVMEVSQQDQISIIGYDFATYGPRAGPKSEQKSMFNWIHYFSVPGY